MDLLDLSLNQFTGLLLPDFDALPIISVGIYRYTGQGTIVLRSRTISDVIKAMKSELKSWIQMGWRFTLTNFIGHR